jgi:GABA permease
MSSPPIAESSQLSTSLRQRHLTMIGLGGVIGAGLFVGSGAVIAVTGPAAIISYLLSGLLIVLTMRALGEMAAASPGRGSFVEYTRRALGSWAGFTTGWLYWYFWVIVVGFEAVAGAGILGRWVDAPMWAMALGLMVLMTITNLWSVRSYGEFEFWFASIKIAAIVSFLILGVTYVIGAWPDKGLEVVNLYGAGGFAPEGLAPIFTGVVVVIFSMVGAEIVTVAAAESAEPEKAVVRATNTVISRVLLFYVGSIILLVTVLPWNDARLGESPYVAALEVMGIPGAADIMNAVVLTAVLSCLNSGLYTASRVLFSLAGRGDAPAAVTETNRRGVPVKSILACTVVGYVGVVMAYVSPETVFMFLLNSSGAIVLFVYGLIIIAQIRMRGQLEREAPGRLKLKMWLFPYLSIATVAGIGLVVASMYWVEGARSQLLLSLLSLAFVLVAYRVRAWRAGRLPAVPGFGRTLRFAPADSEVTHH